MAEIKPLAVTVIDVSLRDWLAGMALSGMAQNLNWNYLTGPCNAAAAERCYAIADAMLRERSKNVEEKETEQ